MASYLEFQDFAVNSVCSGKLLTEQLVDVQTLGVNIEEIWQKFDTPPLSPDQESDGGSSPTSSSSGSLEASEDDSEGQAEDQRLLDELLACHQLLSANYSSDEEWSANSVTVTDFPQLQSNLLIQDCMWNSQMYEPRNQLCTPAPSPPPSPQKQAVAEAGVDEIDTEPQIECVEPAADLVVPTEQVKPGELPEQSVVEQADNVKVFTRERERRSVMVTISSARVQPQATAQSESEEEIDVVTVVERDQRPSPASRKRPSVSAPCSRQSSPTPVSPNKRKKSHQPPPAKRFRRLQSADSGQEGGDSDDEVKRESHNILERKRRNDLKYSFQLLRGQIPELEDVQRAPKVIILKKATDLIVRLQKDEGRKIEELKQEQERRVRLLKKIAFLKSLPSL